MIRGVIAAILYGINLILLPSLLFLMASIRFCIPFVKGKQKCSDVMRRLPEYWISLNNAITDATSTVTWTIQGLEGLAPARWYLILANHQSWVDILVLQRVFNRKIPLLKFFMKRELLWTLPFASWACWLLGFPFMVRHSKKTLIKKPELRFKDIEMTRAACARFKEEPTTVVNFVEGSRFTEEKRAGQNAPYVHLLKPKSGGIAFALSILGDAFHEILDITIVYSKPRVSAWDFFSGKIPEIRVIIEKRPITRDLIGDYERDRSFRVHFQAWLNQVWREKDARISAIINDASH